MDFVVGSLLTFFGIYVTANISIHQAQGNVAKYCSEQLTMILMNHLILVFMVNYDCGNQTMDDFLLICGINAVCSSVIFVSK